MEIYYKNFLDENIIVFDGQEHTNQNSKSNWKKVKESEDLIKQENNPFEVFAKKAVFWFQSADDDYGYLLLRSLAAFTNEIS